MESYKIINRELEKLYGKDIAGRPIYKIVQNLNLVEKRKGLHGNYYGDILLNEEYGVREVPKYSYIAEGLWILERLFYTTNSESAEKFTYEPIWVFRDPKTNGYQMPVLSAVQFIIRCANEGPTKVLSDEEERIKEENTFYEKLGGNPGISDALAADAGVSFAGLNPSSKEK